jgi:hypothetical protein
MSSIKPSRRWQPAFYPFKKEKFGRRFLGKTELFVKGPLFGCRMCGNCLLQETAFICPMECPKGMRNGPCGGTTPSKNCYIDESRRCIWYCIYKRAEQLGREEMLLEVLPPLDWEKVGTETWGEVAQEEGIQIALELIDSIKRKKGVNGIYIMSLGWESAVERIVTDSGLLRK